MPVLEGRQHEQLARDVVVLALLGQLVGDVEQAIEVLRHVHVARRALHRRQLVDGRVQVLAQLGHVGAGLDQQRAGTAVLLVEQRAEHVRGLHELVVAPDGQGLGVGQGRLESAGEFVHSHRRQNGAPAPCVQVRESPYLGVRDSPMGRILIGHVAAVRALTRIGALGQWTVCASPDHLAVARKTRQQNQTLSGNIRSSLHCHK